MSMKAAASLTGSLLARKGAAYPAAYSAPSSAPSPSAPAESDDQAQPQRAYNDPRVIASAPPQPAAAPVAPEDSQLQDGHTAPGAPPADAPEPAASTPRPESGDEDVLSIPQVMDKMGRVRLSVRLDPDRYLRVKMASARTRWSAQDIVIAALDRYLGGAAGKASGNAASNGDAEDGGEDDEGSVN